MSVLDRVKFWKREEAPPASDSPSYDLGQRQDPLQYHDPLVSTPSMQPDPSYPMVQQQYPAQQPFPGSQPQQWEQPPADHSVSPRDVELILAKLDAIKSELDSLHQRVRRVEQVTDPAQKEAQRRYW